MTKPTATDTSHSLLRIGMPIPVETAKKAAAAALEEARKNGWLIAVAVVDPYGTLVYYEKMDHVQIASADVAIAKARSSALFKRATKMFADKVAAGGSGLRTLGLPGAIPLEGGVPLILGGQLSGAIGVSGMAADKDDICALAAAAAISER